MERLPAVVRFAQTALGKAALLWLFYAGLVVHGFDDPIRRMLVLAAITFFPMQRPLWLVIGALLLLFPALPFDWEIVEKIGAGTQVGAYLHETWFRTLIVACAALPGVCYYRAADRLRDRFPSSRPVATLVALYIGALTVASYVPMPPSLKTLLWSVLVVAGPYLWYLAYSLADIRSPATPPIGLQLGYYRPLWLGWNLSFVPFPKGAAYLRKIEAKTEEQLAVTRIKGVKLLYWALVLAYVKRFVECLVYGVPLNWWWLPDLPVHLGAFELGDALARSFDGHPLSWHANWLALIANFAVRLASFSVWGHVVIATCRMAGFAALRNTCRPLESTTIAEFWNRYYYYFKELMVEFFFYPTYLRYFRKQPKVRRFAATLAAAGLGNVLYHYLYDLGEISAFGVWGAWINFRVYWVYALTLATAIGISQLRHGGRRPPPSGTLHRIAACASVVLFFCVLSVFDEPDRRHGLTEHLRFLGHLLPGL